MLFQRYMNGDGQEDGRWRLTNAPEPNDEHGSTYTIEEWRRLVGLRHQVRAGQFGAGDTAAGEPMELLATFTRRERNRLAFLRWLRAHGRLGD
jgi:hypothetical protein